MNGLDIDDIVEYLVNYATKSEKEEIGHILSIDVGEYELPNGTLLDQMKSRLLLNAFDKYTLEELEEKLGVTYV